jgi:pimeloyl-ACP methyl ester carboxylesterase
MDQGDETMKRLGKVLLVLIALLAVAFVALRTPDTDPAAMKAKYGAAPSQFVDLGGGLTVHLRDEGPRDALPIMLLHGSNADLHTWEPWAAELSKTHRVIRFDTIGHGLTGAAPDKNYSAEAMAELVGRVADKLGLSKFVLGGNSMGGAVAVTYALAHPERLSGLVLVDAGGAPKPGGEPGNIGFKLAATPGVNKLMGQITPRWLVERSLSQSVSNQAIVTPAAVDRYWELLRYPGNREATMIRFATPRRTFDPARLAAIKLPTLILWGEQDSLIGVEAAHWYQRSIPGSKLVIYPGIGHLPQEEAAEQSANDVSLFVTVRRVWEAAARDGT